MPRTKPNKKQYIKYRKIYILKLSILQKVTFKFNIISAKIPVTFRDLLSIFKVYLEDQTYEANPKNFETEHSQEGDLTHTY